MSNLEFIESLQALGWSEALAAHRLGVTTRTIARWKKGGTPRGIPKTVALTIRAYMNQLKG
jgi:hypothetical protein